MNFILQTMGNLLIYLTEKDHVLIFILYRLFWLLFAVRYEQVKNIHKIISLVLLKMLKILGKEGGQKKIKEKTTTQELI